MSDKLHPIPCSDSETFPEMASFKATDRRYPAAMECARVVLSVFLAALLCACAAQDNEAEVQVKVQLQPASTTISVGSELSLPCNVDGYPTPRVSWTKDGVTLTPTDTMWITDTRLTIPRTTLGDSGKYGCHADNQYSSDSSIVQITVQEVVVPSKCTDSPYFANCALIVQGRFCRHTYYSRFCCKSCVEAGQLSPNDVEMQADESYRKK